MSGTSPRRADPIARSARPLPATPHLEYERKQAKALLKQLHAGDPDALRRVQAAHPAALRDTRVEALQLSDVQHVIAREYGFTSWPRMVEYFEVLEGIQRGDSIVAGPYQAVRDMKDSARVKPAPVTPVGRKP